MSGGDVTWLSGGAVWVSDVGDGDVTWLSGGAAWVRDLNGSDVTCQGKQCECVV